MYDGFSLMDDIRAQGGAGVKTLHKGSRLNADEDTIGRSSLILGPNEGGNAGLKYCKALKHVSLYSTVIAKIPRSLVVLIWLHQAPDWRS